MNLRLKPYMAFIATIAFASCQPDNNEKGGFAETHPKLEKQLVRDSIKMPITDNENPDLYQRYRITMEKYHTTGKYEVGDMYRGRLAPLDEKSHKEATTYRSALSEGLKGGVNFAGKYTVVTVGCGTSCQMHYVIDRETGKILDKIHSSMGARYNATSRLFIVNPPDSTVNYNACTNCTPTAYVFENGKFKEVPKD